MQLKKNRLWLLPALVLSLSCSPIYLLKASVKEGLILARRQEISALLSDPEIAEATKRKLLLVNEVRRFCKDSLDLDPGESYTTYTKVQEKVLVWVLSASPKDSLSAVTWWFPIVGSVPYKGFFSQKDALEAAEELRHKNLDTYVRGSSAFSTLGWFNDPLLSTFLDQDDPEVVDTLVHELVHRRVWVKNSVPFNESLANFFSFYGAALFFEARGAERELSSLKASRLDELAAASFLQAVERELRSAYAKGKERGDALENIIAERERIFWRFRTEWSKVELKTAGYRALGEKLNNAVIIALRTYLTGFELFEQLYLQCSRDLKKFLAEIDEIADLAKQGVDPFVLLKFRTERGEMPSAAEIDNLRLQMPTLEGGLI